MTEDQTGPLSVDIITGNSPKVEIRRSPVHGYGVFAKELIEAGELIEQCRLLRLGYRSNYNHDPVLKDYVWANYTDTEESRQHGNAQYVALGFGSMYNHSDNPNTVQFLHFDTQVMEVKAGRTIHKDEEIFVTYGKKYFMIRDFWKNIHENNALEKMLEKQKQ